MVELLWLAGVGCAVAMAAIVPLRCGLALGATALPPLGLLLARAFC
jgi:hypothetical protein